MGLFSSSPARAANSPDTAMDPVMETLAPRILYSADAAAVVAPLTPDEPVQALLSQPAEQPNQIAQAQQPSSLVVIDDGIDDVESLLTFLAAEQRSGVNVDWLVIDQQTDGIEAVANALHDSETPYDAIHVFSHGTDAKLTLGTAVVDQDSLAAHSDSLAAWGAGLGADADILLYACDFSTNEQGKALADNLATMTGADIATSNNTSGHHDLGGDWILENKTGAIEAPVLISPQLSTNWVTTLAITPSTVEFSVPQDQAEDDFLQSNVGSRQVATNGTMTVVVWERNDEITFRRFQIDGTPLDLTDQQIENNQGDNQSRPAVAMASNGDFAIAWTTNGGSGGLGVNAQFFDSDGSSKPRPGDAYPGSYTNANEFRVNLTTLGNQLNPTVTARADDSFAISWSGPFTVLGNTSEGVAFAIHDLDGSRIRAEQIASVGVGTDEQIPAIASHPVDNTMIIVFEQDLADNRIQMRRLEANGDLISPLLNFEIAGRDLTNPSVAIADNGIAYITVIADEDDVLMWLVGTDNTLLTPNAIQVNEVSGGRLLAADVEVEGNDTVVVAWQTDQGPDREEIAIRQYDGSGNPLGGESYVNSDTDGHQRRPSLAVTGNTALVVWSGESATDTDGVFMRQLTISPPGLRVTASGDTTTEEGGTITLAVRLETQPLGTVNVVMASADSSEGALSTSSIAFDATDWDVEQIVTVTGLDDLIVDGDTPYSVSLIANSTDPAYDSLAATIIALTNTDNDPVPSTPIGPVSDTDPSANQISENSPVGTAVGITAFADDPDAGDNVTYSLSGASAGFFNIGLSSGVVTTSATPLDYESANIVSVTVVATSDDTTTNQRTYTLSVLNENDNPPVIGAGQTFSIDENSPNTTLVGTPSATDADGPTLFGNWTITGGTGAAVFSINSGNGQIRVIDQSALDFESTPSLTLTLTTSDSVNTSAPETVTINLNDVNDAPFGLNRTSTGLEDTELVLDSSQFILNDPDLANYLLGIEVRSLPGVGSLLLNGTALDGSTSLPLFVATTALDNGDLVYLPPADANGPGLSSFGVGVVDQDGASSVTRQQTIDINPVDDPPEVTSFGGVATVAISIDENTSVVGTVQATDTEAGLIQYAGTGADAAFFNVDANTGAVLFLAAPDFETPLDFDGDNQYEITVQATDPASNADSQALTVTVLDVNEAPLGADATSTGIEDNNVSLFSSEFVLNDPDAGDSLQGIEVRSLPGTGALLLNGTALDGSTTLPLFLSTAQLNNGDLAYQPPANVNGLNLATFDIAVVDHFGERSVTRQQSIDISAVDDPPVINSYGGAAAVTIDIAENSLIVGAVTATDAESSLMQYSFSGPDAMFLNVDPNSGEIRFIISPDFETPQDSGSDNQYEITVEARDPANNTDTQALTINVTNQNDAAPIIAPGQSFPLSETATIGTAVNTPAVTDPDGPVTFTNWTITGGTGSGAFSIDSVTGLISVSDASTLDFETSSTLTLQLIVSDGVNPSAAETVSIALINVNETPLSADGLSTGIEDTDYVFSLGDFAFTDPDVGDTLGAIVLTDLPDSGQLVLNGVPLDGLASLPVTVQRADLLAGTFIYRPAPNTAGTAITNFTFAVADAVGAQSAQATQTLGLVPVNDAPIVGGSQQAMISTGGSFTFGSSLLTTTDVEDDAGSVFYTVVTDPAQGALLMDGQPIAQGDRFSQADINAGRIRYESQATAETVDSINLRVADSEGAVVANVTVSITTLGNSVTAPPPDDQTTPPRSTENEPTDSAESADDGSDDEDQQAAVIGVVSPAPVYNPSGGNSASDSTSLSGDKDNDFLQLVSSRVQQDQQGAGRWLTSGHYGSDLARSDLDILGLSSNYSRPDYDRLADAMLTTDFARMRDILGDDFARQLEFDRTVVASSVAFSASMSIGYVLWLLRSGALLSSVLASIPAWRAIDPLPILASIPNRDSNKNDKSLEQMVDRQETAVDDDADPKNDRPAPY